MLTFDRSRIWNRWIRFCHLLFSPLAPDDGPATWLGAGVASLVFACAVPVIDFAPRVGYVFLAGQLLTILLLSARHGRAGAWGGFVLSIAAYFSAYAATILSGTIPRPVVPEPWAMLVIGALTVLVCARFGEAAVQHRRMARDLGAAEARLGAMFNAMPSGFLMLDPYGRIVFSNQMARRLLACDAPEETGHTVPALVSQESWPPIRAQLSAPVPGRVIRVTTRGTGVRQTEWTFARFLDQGEPRVLAFLWDAEESRRREEETSAVAAALRCLQEGVVLANLDGTIRYANPAAAQIYGFSERQEIIGRSIRDLVAPGDLPGLDARLSRAGQTGGECDIRLRRPDGGETEVRVTTSPVRKDGALIGTIGVLRDLTEARELARRASASDKQVTLGRLVAGAAHEINNPLTAILASSELLHDQPGLDEEGRDLLSTIHAECGRAGRIVRDLLSFARQRPVTRTTLDLGEVVQAAVALRQGYTRAAGIELALFTPTPAPVTGDVDQLKQVVLNLLVNAEDAVAGAPIRRITVTVARRGGYALLLVNDSGPGVPEGIQDQIFDPFFTTKPDGHGTGLGLAVSSGIVSEHGGRISATRGVLGGAQFAVELPLAEAVEDIYRGAEDLPPPVVVAGRLKVLIVDDEPAILSAVGRILQRLGHDVSTAGSGGDALMAAQLDAYDVIISDLRMPGMSGRELHRRLTEEGILPATDFIVSTGDIADPEAHAFLKATGLPVLLKPFEVRNLVEMLGQCRAVAPRAPVAIGMAG